MFLMAEGTIYILVLVMESQSEGTPTADMTDMADMTELVRKLDQS